MQGRRLTKEEFIEKARQVHGDKYDYSKVEYKNNKTKICIVCPIHGEFWQRPNDHLNGRGCDKCGGTATMTLQDFIEKSNIIHKNKYDYSKVEYTNYETKVYIVCPKHGEFWQNPHSHLNGCGCPKCNESHLEKEIREYLDRNSIKYESSKKFKWLGRQHLDFYLPDYNIAIECQGEQHFKPIDFGNKGVKWAINEFNRNVQRDKIKNELCKNNNIKIIYFSNVKDKLNSNIIYNINEIKEKIIEYGYN